MSYGRTLTMGKATLRSGKGQRRGRIRKRAHGGEEKKQKERKKLIFHCAQREADLSFPVWNASSIGGLIGEKPKRGKKAGRDRIIGHVPGGVL